MKEITCQECKYFYNDPHLLEKIYHGLNTLSSAWGCVRGDAGICVKHQVYLFPRGRCKDFVYRESNSREEYPSSLFEKECGHPPSLSL